MRLTRTGDARSPADPEHRPDRQPRSAGLSDKETSMTNDYIPQGAGHHRPRRMSLATLLLVSAGCAVVIAGCSLDEEGSGDLATVRYQDLDDVDITGLSVRDDIDVAVRVDPSSTQSARVTVDDNLLDRGQATIDDGVLSIGFDGLGDVAPSSTPLVVLTVPSLDSVHNHADGNVVVTGFDGGSVDVANTDGGAITAFGTVDRVELDASSDGNVDLSHLVAGTVELGDTDDGNVTVYATESIEGEISGDADVVVRGDPAETDVDFDGHGDLVAA